MAKKTFKVDVLSPSSIRQLQADLEKYKTELTAKCETFVKRLAEVGISVAKNNAGKLGHYIVFSVRTDPKKDGCSGILLATETGKIVNKWRTKDGIKSADVSPLLMTEFGSGWKAENPLNVPGVGQGTFPDQSHAFDPDGWHWQELDGTWKHSKGISPEMPMFKASMEMQNAIFKTAKEVFK